MTIKPADTDAWNLAEGESAGKLMLIRYRPNLANFVGDARYPRRLTIKWSYEEQDPSGMPSDVQSGEMRAFEDLVIPALEQEQIGVIAFVYTNSGSREWHFYISDVEAVGSKINEALQEQPALPIALAVEDDPEWEEFSLLLQQCS